MFKTCYSCNTSFAKSHVNCNTILKKGTQFDFLSHNSLTHFNPHTRTRSHTSLTRSAAKETRQNGNECVADNYILRKLMDTIGNNRNGGGKSGNPPVKKNGNPFSHILFFFLQIRSICTHVKRNAASCHDGKDAGRLVWHCPSLRLLSCCLEYCLSISLSLYMSPLSLSLFLSSIVSVAAQTSSRSKRSDYGVTSSHFPLSQNLHTHTHTHTLHCAAYFMWLQGQRSTHTFRKLCAVLVYL